jgi:FAD:protein FMN transferase
MRKRSFSAMGTTVEVVAPDEAESFEESVLSVMETFALEEQRFSRFRPSSELSRLNASVGEWTAVSAEMAEVLSLAIAWAERTGGVFDPTLLRALEAAGYDRTFDEIEAGARADEGVPGGGWRDIEVDGHRVRLPEGVGVDLGGLVKGWSVDRALEDLTPDPWILISAGGDLRLKGDAPDGVEIAIEDPFTRGNELLRLRLHDGALATSSVARRTWAPGLHHLIDPSTGSPLRSPVVQTTAWADTGATAEVLAKWMLFRGAEAMRYIPGILVLDEGEVRVGVTDARERAA